MTTLADLAGLAQSEQGLAVIATTRADGTVQASVVNIGILAHPTNGDDVLAFVTYGRAKLAHLRERPTITVVVRSGWQWAAAEGTAEIIGPDDPAAGIDDERLRLLRREVFTAAGGTHDDWNAYDTTMVEQRRAVVLVAPTRVYSN